MSLVAAAITKQSMISYKNDLEYKILLINQAKMGLTESVNELMNSGTDMDPENPAMKVLEQRKERLNLLEKKLDLQLSEYKAKLEMAEANLGVAEQMESSAIKSMGGH